jgi:hypothetical protein
MYSNLYTRLHILVQRLWRVSQRPAQNDSLSFMEFLAANEFHIVYRVCFR